MKINFNTFSKLTFSQGTGLALATIVLLAGLLICLLTWVNLTTQLEQKTYQDAQRQLQRLAVTLAPSMIAQDRISLNISLNEWSRGPELHGIQVFNNSQVLIAESGRIRASSAEISQVITQDKIVIGSLRASINMQPSQDITLRYLGLGLLASFLCALLSGLAGWVLCDYFFAYLHRFADAAERWQLTGAELKLPTPPALPQLNRLHQVFVRCADQQQKHQDIENALEQFAGNLNSCSIIGQYQSSALLFIEINNLKELQKNLSAEQLISTLNRYNWLLVQAVKLYHGRLERYAGNGVAVLFTPESGDKSEQTALHCLYAAQLFLGLIQRECIAPSSPNIDLRVALHFGEVLLAPIADSKSNRHDLVGDTLHWAAHLASTAQPHTILVSDAFYTQLPSDTEISWVAAAAVNDLRGNTQKSWQLASLPEKTKALIERQIEHLM